MSEEEAEKKVKDTFKVEWKGGGFKKVTLMRGSTVLKEITE